MCIFSQAVRYVSNTRIYARCDHERQILVYEMRFASDGDLAMILPVPTNGQEDDRMKFISLADYPRFFDDMDRCFPDTKLTRAGSGPFAVAAAATLVVHRVGAFDATFVPSMEDFGRLDTRFRLSEDVWRQLPRYSDFGFAVFQLRAGDMQVHPMALSFATRHPETLYFPTSHVHDGIVHPVAAFDHTLYAQVESAAPGWRQGKILPEKVMNFGNLLVADRTRGLVDRGAPLVRLNLIGDLPNQDVWLPLAGVAA